MRVLVPLLVFASLTLSGCAGYELEGFVPPEETDDGNVTMAPVRVGAPNSTVPGTEPAAYPQVAGIAVASYTAPVAIELDRVEGEAATLSLVADERGLRCVSVPHDDPLASPAGYKAVSSWARCSLSAGDKAFTAGAADTMSAEIPMMRGIPVEAFTWNMTVGRVLVNNTGEHEEVLDEVLRDQTAAPSLGLRHEIMQDGFFYTSSWYEVCSTFLTYGVATLHLESVAHNGRAALSLDTHGFRVVDITGGGENLGDLGGADANDTANRTVPHDRVDAVWWQDGETVHALGAWAHDSTAALQVTIHFEGESRGLGLLPPLDCPDALFVDYQHLPVAATATGIAAGWADIVDGRVDIAVWHTL